MTERSDHERLAEVTEAISALGLAAIAAQLGHFVGRLKAKEERIEQLETEVAMLRGILARREPDVSDGANVVSLFREAKMP